MFAGVSSTNPSYRKRVNYSSQVEFAGNFGGDLRGISSSCRRTPLQGSCKIPPLAPRLDDASQEGISRPGRIYSAHADCVHFKFCIMTKANCSRFTARHDQPLHTDRYECFCCFYNLLAALALSDAVDSADVVVLGGKLRGITRTTVGVSKVKELGRYALDVAFIRANCIGPAGLFTPSLEDAAIKEAALVAAKRRILLADASKRTLMPEGYLFAQWHMVDTWVVDSAALPEPITEAIKASGTHVIVA